MLYTNNNICTLIVCMGEKLMCAVKNANDKPKVEPAEPFFKSSYELP